MFLKLLVPDFLLIKVAGFFFPETLLLSSHTSFPFYYLGRITLA
jgi:hypothetical protein